jgi:hypothetical protein
MALTRALSCAAMALVLSACNAQVKEFSAVPRHICAGERVELQWNVAGSASVTVTPPNAELPDGPVNDVGHATIGPTRADVLMRLDQIFDRGARVVANRVQTLVSGIFQFAIKRGMVDENSAAKVARPGKEDPRERVLSDDEMRALWALLDAGDAELDRFVPIIRLGLLTAQREGEIVGMRWDELDLERGWWTILGERTKNGLTHRVPLVGGRWLS